MVGLIEYRVRTAECSGGISSDRIKQLVTQIITDLGLRGRVLDYGAGIGELITLLYPRSELELHGADIMPKPSSVPDSVPWYQIDLNERLDTDTSPFDVVICSEVIEHLENPRATFRNLFDLLKKGGALILTMPNQESARSYLNLIFRGHFVAFNDREYPAHITALLRTDLKRLCMETGFTEPMFLYTDQGWMPATRTTWQKFSFGLFRGRLFSDNIAAVVTKPLA